MNPSHLATPPIIKCVIDPDTYDFERRFPPPQDEALHRAGRQGMLDQKENSDLSDAEWLSIQHACWRGELQAYIDCAAQLMYCVAHGLDPHTSQRPRTQASWPSLLTRMTAEIEHCTQQREALLDDYARYFGELAAARFSAYVSTRTCAVTPIQQSLF